MKKYDSIVKNVMDRARQNDVYAILRLGNDEKMNVSLTNAQVTYQSYNTDLGVGVSVFTKDGAQGFATTARLDEQGLNDAVDLAIILANSVYATNKSELNKDIFDIKPLNGEFYQNVNYNPREHDINDIAKNLLNLNSYLLTKNKDVIPSMRFGLGNSFWRIARSDGTDVSYNIPLARIMTSLYLKDGSNNSNLHFALNGNDLGVVLDNDKKILFEKRADKHIALLEELLSAGKINAGNYKALLSANFSGLLAHEAVGHTFETDKLIGTVIEDGHGKIKLGEKIAADNISFIDEPFENSYGNQFISANGILRDRVEFIKNGVVVDGLSDIFSAKSAGVEIHGCGRIESYAHLPIPRMSATYMLDNNAEALPKSLDDMTIQEIANFLKSKGELKPGEKIVYPVIGMGGQTNSMTGKFMFNCAGIYLLEENKITLYKQSAFSGNIIGGLLARTRGFGELSYDSSGMCGKSGQSVPVADGGNELILLDKNEHISFGGQ